MASIAVLNTSLNTSLSSSCELFRTLPDVDTNYELCKYGLLNKDKNRYDDILPLDASRVVLDDDSYINASFLDLTNGTKMIACQGPLPNTIYDFWSMILQYNIPVILMVTPLVENGRVKCTKYWPDPNMTNIVSKPFFPPIPSISIKNLSSRSILENFIETNLEITQGDKIIKVTHLYYSGWQDKTDTDINELECVITVTKSLLPKNEIFACHCSAGIGRTGVVATIFRCMSSNESILQAIAELRKARQGLVQNVKQYCLIRDFLKHINKI